MTWIIYTTVFATWIIVHKLSAMFVAWINVLSIILSLEHESRCVNYLCCLRHESKTRVRSLALKASWVVGSCSKLEILLVIGCLLVMMCSCFSTVNCFPLKHWIKLLKDSTVRQLRRFFLLGILRFFLCLRSAQLSWWSFVSTCCILRLYTSVLLLRFSVKFCYVLRYGKTIES